MIPEVKDEERGPLQWKIEWNGIRGGSIKAKITKKRMTFTKRFVYKDNESFEIAQKVLRNKVTRLLHYRNEINTEIGRLAQYAIDATSIEEKDFEMEEDDPRFFRL